MLLIHEDTSTHSTEPIFPTSALHKSFQSHISLALTSSSCFLFQSGGFFVVRLFCCFCLFGIFYFVRVFCLHVCVSVLWVALHTLQGCRVFLMWIPSWEEGRSWQQKWRLFAGKIICSLEYEKKLLLLTSSGPTLCSRHLYSHENDNVPGINSKKWQQLAPLQLPAPAVLPITTETSNQNEKLPPQPMPRAIFPWGKWGHRACLER